MSKIILLLFLSISLNTVSQQIKLENLTKFTSLTFLEVQDQLLKYNFVYKKSKISNKGYEFLCFSNKEDSSEEVYIYPQDQLITFGCYQPYMFYQLLEECSSGNYKLLSVEEFKEHSLKLVTYKNEFYYIQFSQKNDYAQIMYEVAVYKE